ncbi:Mediator of RNA polymerase II transcription subunit 17 [Apostasia shenzhenica]|uniref:Mediator of RNA polymerase II transcription subunit 17 n=1 Tax=Apostasia shenzhenica TaxID=1088818 RepID=A0A2I0BA58_9ASPA|nr:Mediator of RNA polymerase II transcription subunit 17 [Apostasia shenzhenica]
MEGTMKIDLDKLPIKRLEAIDEAGNEQFPPDIGYEEKRLNMIRRIDFSSVVEKDSKKQKNSKEVAGPQVWPWQSLVENLQLAQQELSIILDLINTVEANDAVTVAGMQRPKQLPHEALSDIAVSAATKLQRLRHLGRYFKQSSKALERQVSREVRFYGSLIRLQQNWKVKRLRLGLTSPSSENFTIDLLDNSMTDFILSTWSSALSTVRIDHDPAGNLTVELPSKLLRSLYIEFPGFHSSNKQKSFIKKKIQVSDDHSRDDKSKAFTADDINNRVKDSHLVLREIQRSIFQEQVFDLVYHDTFNPSRGVNVVAMREDSLHLSIGQETSVSLCLLPPIEEGSIEKTDSACQAQKQDGISSSNSLGLVTVEEKQDPYKKNYFNFCDPVCLEIYLQYLFHKNVFLKAKDKSLSNVRLQAVSQPAGSGNSLLGHFCMTIAHRIFSQKVLSVLERLVEGVPYLHLLSHPTWHSRISSWSVSLKVPHSILHSSRRIKPTEGCIKCGVRSQFHTKIVVNDDQIIVSGECAASIVGSLRGNCLEACSINSYGCNLVDLPMVILQQVAGQVIHWIYEEAMVVGMKVSRDFLCLYFELDHGETLGLVANVDAEDIEGCISWWLVFDDGSMEEGKLAGEDGDCKNRRFLGHLSLEALHSTLMDLVSLCSAGSH